MSFVVLFVFAAVVSSAELVDRIVAIIDRDVVMLSEAERAKALLKIRGADPGSLASVVERMIESHLIEKEVARFTDEPVPEDRVQEALAKVRARFGNEEAYRAALAVRGIPEREVSIELERQLEVSRYLERRFRALTYVSDEEIDQYFEQKVLPGLDAERGPTVEEIDQIRRILEEQKFSDRVDRWIEGLKERAGIRRYVW